MAKLLESIYKLAGHPALNDRCICTDVSPCWEKKHVCVCVHGPNIKMFSRSESRNRKICSVWKAKNYRQMQNFFLYFRMFTALLLWSPLLFIENMLFLANCELWFRYSLPSVFTWQCKVQSVWSLQRCTQATKTTANFCVSANFTFFFFLLFPTILCLGRKKTFLWASPLKHVRPNFLSWELQLFSIQLSMEIKVI